MDSTSEPEVCIGYAAQSADAVQNILKLIDGLTHEVRSLKQELDASKHENRSRLIDLKTASDKHTEQNILILKQQVEILEKMNRRDQTEINLVTTQNPDIESTLEATIQSEDQKLRAFTPLRDMPPAQPLPRSTNDRTSPLGGNSLNNSMDEWSLVGPGNQGNIIPRVVHGTVSKDDSVGSSRSPSTLMPSKAMLNNSCSEDRDTLSFRSTDTDTDQKTVEGETSTPDTSLITTSFKRNAGEGSSYYTEGSNPNGNENNLILDPEGSNLHVPPMGSDAGEESTYRERGSHLDQEGPTPSTSLDPTAIKPGYSSTYNDNESQIIQGADNGQPSNSPNQSPVHQGDPRNDETDVNQTPEPVGPNTDVNVTGVRADGESTYYNNERQVTQSDGPDIPAQPTKLRPISIKSGDSSTMDIEDSTASHANSSNIDVRSHGGRNGEDSAYHTDGSQRSGSDLNQIICPESPTSPVTSLGPNVGDAASFYENREHHRNNAPIREGNPRHPIRRSSDDSDGARRKDGTANAPEQPFCPICNQKFATGTHGSVVNEHANTHFGGSMVKMTTSLPPRSISGTLRPEPSTLRPITNTSRPITNTSPPILDNSPKTPNNLRLSPDTSRPTPDTTRPTPNASRPMPNTMRPKPLLCIMCPKSFPANQQREYEAHVQTHVV